MPQKTLTLNATTRTETGKKAANLRLIGLIPAVIYGHGLETKILTLVELELEKTLQQISESDLVDLVIDNEKPIKVLFHDISRDPLTNKFVHIDFYQVRMDEKIKTEIALNFMGESGAVKDLGAVLIKTLDSIEIECLPGDLISHLDVDLNALNQLGTIIRAKDLKIPATLTLLTDPETPIALAEEPKKEEILTAAPSPKELVPAEVAEAEAEKENATEEIKK
ncbi:50S ribosomal protein L25 [Candidatus Kuenenbacteria bacterium CG10_big_fil_rev_8_21_14_0_10_36_11]|uniref:Large ribosomal subunit protein bL25 n=1 Tax=Candidatus Kuenenbacteria bacterium CG10_big_fil_rev_8_21_14_0_10_36_11 TaxID=1974618 RepID=A0A2M6WA10_9BACT|nr:MAG: 50S ribosomal protein L25 [Candidatus Kuenenbacteria bacterium CG10_big_fil_rev_8_21_14_0_10_36_11]